MVNVSTGNPAVIEIDGVEYTAEISDVRDGKDGITHVEVELDTPVSRV